MKQILFFLTLFTAQSYLAQVWHCDQSYVDESMLANPGSPVLDSKSSSELNAIVYEPIVMNVVFHVVNDDNGNRTIPIGEDEVMNVIRDLNVNFGQFQIFFKYKGFNNINESDYLILDLTGSGTYPLPEDLHTYGVNNNYHTGYAINIYIVDEIRNYATTSCAGDLGDVIVPGFIWGSATPTDQGTVNQASLYIMAEYFNTGVTMHEMGHFFNLKHTNQGGCGNSPYGEHVTRDESSADYNATYTGDRVIDTPASPAFYDAHEINDNCEYVGLQQDYLGVYYNTQVVPVKNFMNVNDLAHIYCLEEFTPRQGERMRHMIDISGGLYFTLMMNTVASLYQPFEVMDVPGDAIVSVTPITSNTATVCRNRLRQHRFQKGFHYDFQNTYAPDVVTADPDDLPIVKNSTYQFEVSIAELDPNYYATIEVICTKGTICNEEPYISGKLLSTPFLGSPLMELQLLDQEEVNDPKFLESLESKQYYILTKETESGGTVQTIIYKD